MSFTHKWVNMDEVFLFRIACGSERADGPASWPTPGGAVKDAQGVEAQLVNLRGKRSRSLRLQLADLRSTPHVSLRRIPKAGRGQDRGSFRRVVFANGQARRLEPVHMEVDSLATGCLDPDGPPFIPTP